MGILRLHPRNKGLWRHINSSGVQSKLSNQMEFAATGQNGYLMLHEFQKADCLQKAD